MTDLTPEEITTCLHKLDWGSRQASSSTDLKPQECAWLLKQVAKRRRKEANGK